MNAGLSVSRVGGAAQRKIIRKLGGGVRLALAQYRELAAFAQFASDLDEATRKQLDTGKLVTELMKQKQYAPMKVSQLALTLYAIERGFLGKVPVEKALKVEGDMQAMMQAKHKRLMDSIDENPELTEALEAELKKALTAFFDSVE